MAKSKHEISLEEEQALILEAQDGSKTALTMLVSLDLPFLRAYAARVVRNIVHKPDVEPDVEDLVSAGLVEFIRRVHTYDAKKSNGARLRNYAFLDVKRAMVRQACDGLESVRLPRDNRVHKAHRDMEQGMSSEELADAHPELPEQALRSLHRTTVSLEHMASYEELGHTADDAVESMLALVWPRLRTSERHILMLRRLDIPARTRARYLGIPYRCLRLRELRLWSKIRGLLASIEGEEPLKPHEISSVVWDELTHDERRTIYSIGFLNDATPWQRSLWLRRPYPQARAMERDVVRKVRMLVA